MYDFIQQMFDFAVSEVLESRWAELKKRLDEAETVDQLLKDHDNFLNTCTNECLLTNEKLLDVRIESFYFRPRSRRKLTYSSRFSSSFIRSCSTLATSLPTIPPPSHAFSSQANTKRTEIGRTSSSNSIGTSSPSEHFSFVSSRQRVLTTSELFVCHFPTDSRSISTITLNNLSVSYLYTPLERTPVYSLSSSVSAVSRSRKPDQYPMEIAKLDFVFAKLNLFCCSKILFAFQYVTSLGALYCRRRRRRRRRCGYSRERC